MDMTTLTHFLGWCTLINIVIFLISTVMITLFKGLAMGLHKRLFNVDESFLTQSYFNYLARYKLLIIVFNLVPYSVLRLAL
ncbi:MAG: hypothetical protein GW903_04060 [Alphaproteobacteria bacterium]|nr:hypothetical protein [Alphaproteobacteria bacterium]NCQ88143.1 hypothetical protein [Alphaproteobacteria bacterium]NCT05350.1 hypothetical protein [Alphaproteobacteria bacterium]